MMPKAYVDLIAIVAVERLGETLEKVLHFLWDVAVVKEEM